MVIWIQSWIQLWIVFSEDLSNFCETRIAKMSVT